VQAVINAQVELGESRARHRPLQIPHPMFTGRSVARPLTVLCVLARAVVVGYSL
jgi:hypothetical protein